MAQFENVIRLIGIVEEAPEKIESTNTGCKFKISTKETHYSKQQERMITQTERHMVKAWTHNAEYSLSNIDKGDYVYVVGRMHYHTKDDKYVEGRKIRLAEVIAKRVVKLNRPEFFKQNENSEEE